MSKTMRMCFLNNNKKNARNSVDIESKSWHFQDQLARIDFVLREKKKKRREEHNII